MPGISVHVVDVTRGLPAYRMAVEVWRLDGAGGRVRVGGGAIDGRGVLDDATLSAGGDVLAGTYEVELAAGPWYRGQAIEVGEPAFQETIVYRFHLADPTGHVHLPIKLSPWGVSVWRGH